MESFPCIIQLLGDEPLREAILNSPFAPYADTFVKSVHTVREHPKSRIIYGMRGIKHFMQTGRVPGFYGQFVQEGDLEVRRQMVLKTREFFEQRLDRVFLLDEEQFPIDDGISLEMYGEKKLMIASTSDKYPYKYILLTEPGILATYKDFFEALIDSPMVYPKEETLEMFDRNSGLK